MCYSIERAGRREILVGIQGVLINDPSILIVGLALQQKRNMCTKNKEIFPCFFEGIFNRGSHVENRVIIDLLADLPHLLFKSYNLFFILYLNIIVIYAFYGFASLSFVNSISNSHHDFHNNVLKWGFQISSKNSLTRYSLNL